MPKRHLGFEITDEKVKHFATKGRYDNTELERYQIRSKKKLTRFWQILFSFQIAFVSTRLNFDQEKGFPTDSPALIPKLSDPGINGMQICYV